MCTSQTPEDAPRYLKNTVTRPNGKVVAYARTYVDGVCVSLGRYGDPAGFAEWQRLRDEWLAARDFAIAVEPSRLSVAELAERWLDHEQARAADGRISDKTYAAARAVAEAVVAEHAGMLVTLAESAVGNSLTFGMLGRRGLFLRRRIGRHYEISNRS